jgi:hypothetical protein
MSSINVEKRYRRKGGNVRAGFASSAPFLVSLLMRNLLKKFIHICSGVFLVGTLSSLGLGFGVFNVHYVDVTVHTLIVAAVICNAGKELR